MREQIKRALLEGRVRSSGGKVVSPLLLLDNPFVESEIMSSLVTAYECGKIYIVSK